MGLQSAMTTALTGLQAAETTIDVVGNNVANSSTTGFKESDVLFATQFLQTQSIGSTPSADRGGTNPRQIGLGVKVAGINLNFNQGTIEISANPLDVAIQGDGFLVVQGPSGNLYTRNGQIQSNSANELVTVTGNRVLGYTVDEDFNIIESDPPVALRIPLGGSPVTQATQNAYFTGVLTPLAEVGDTPAIIASEVLGDAAYTFPNDANFDSGDFQTVPAGANPPLDQGNYSYYVTFVGGAVESRPSTLIGPISVGVNENVQISNIPQPGAGSGYTGINIYRNLASDPSEFHLVTAAPLALGTTTYTDSSADSTIEANATIDLMGAKAASGTLLTNVIVRDGDTYTQPFEAGTLSFEGRRGGRTLAGKEFTIDSDTTVQNLIDFMEQAFGIDNSDDLPDSLPTAGGVIDSNGVINFTSHAGETNALAVTLSSFRLTPDGDTDAVPISISFTETQAANGPGSTTDFIVFDSLGIPVNVRIMTVLEEKTGNDTTYRWFALSENNEPLTGVNTAVGTGTITFDGNGIIQGNPVATINIERNQTASESPLVVDLDFSQVSGLALQNSLGESVSTMSMTRQDGFPPGTLSSFIITESGLIRGIFSNGAERPLGQIRMARFANNGGLQQVGENLFSTGVNSGEAIMGNPGENGIGTLTAGALELSNTDIGQNLIELILASTQYRGGARVITTAQQLLDELLSLRR
jgi:flagellar hook protein FlgE